MTLMIIASVVTVGLALAVLAIVASASGNVPDHPKLEKFNEFAEHANKALNGDAEPPRKLVEFVESRD